MTEETANRSLFGIVSVIPGFLAFAAVVGLAALAVLMAVVGFIGRDGF